jgi:hypothetical protein
VEEAWDKEHDEEAARLAKLLASHATMAAATKDNRKDVTDSINAYFKGLGAPAGDEVAPSPKVMERLEPFLRYYLAAATNTVDIRAAKAADGMATERANTVTDIIGSAVTDAFRSKDQYGSFVGGKYVDDPESRDAAFWLQREAMRDNCEAAGNRAGVWSNDACEKVTRAFFERGLMERLRGRFERGDLTLAEFSNPDNIGKYKFDDIDEDPKSPTHGQVRAYTLSSEKHRSLVTEFTTQESRDRERDKRADAAFDAALAKLRKNNYADLLRRTVNPEAEPLTLGEIDEAELRPEDRGTLYLNLSEKPAVGDYEPTVIQVQGLTNDGDYDGARDVVASARGGGHLTQKTAGELIAKIDAAEDNEGAMSPLQAFYEERIRLFLRRKDTFGIETPASTSSQSVALEEYYERVVVGGEGPKDIWRDIARRALATTEMGELRPPLPLGGTPYYQEVEVGITTKTDGSTEPRIEKRLTNLAAVRMAYFKAHAAGELSRPGLDQQDRQLKEWARLQGESWQDVLKAWRRLAVINQQQETESGGE